MKTWLFISLILYSEGVLSQVGDFKKYVEVHGRQMAYMEEGKGTTILFFHGNPTSSYLWRNVIPEVGMGRRIAFDLIGMGDSEKLDHTESDRYTLASHQKYVDGFIKAMKLNRILLVAHDWGGVLAIDWAKKNPERVIGIVFMETFLEPYQYGESPARDSEIDWFKGFRAYRMEDLVLNENYFVEKVLFGTHNQLIDEHAREVYRAPFKLAGESRLPTLMWPRQVPIQGDPASSTEVFETNIKFMMETKIPKLFIGASPGGLMKDREKLIIRNWPNIKEVTVQGNHFIQEQDPVAIGKEIGIWIREHQLNRLRK